MKNVISFDSWIFNVILEKYHRKAKDTQGIFNKSSINRVIMNALYVTK